MGSTFSTKLKVGFTTLFALLILFLGVLWIKAYNPLTQRVARRAVFSNAKGITAGDPVHVSGIKVGEVVSVDLHENSKALVGFSILKSVTLFSDCEMIIEDVGLMGDKALVIKTGSVPPELDPALVHQGIDTTGLSDLIASAEKVIYRLNTIGERLENDLDVAKIVGSFEETMTKLEEALEIYRQVAEENREPLRKSVAGLSASADDLSSFIRDTSPKFQETLDSFQNTSDKLSVALDNLESLSSVVDTLSLYMETGDGTLGKLLKSGDLYEELRQTNANIDAFIIDFKKNPGKYTKDMQFKVRLF